MLPNLIIIGAAKSGTTSLYHYLGEHPEIHMAVPKELRFFSSDWGRGRAWYESHFESDAPVRGEATPQYTNYPRWREVPERMADLIPDARLVYLVRDPIERLVPDIEHVRGTSGRQSPEGFLAAGSDSPAVMRSRYALQLARFLRYFPPAQILVVDQHELLHAREAQLSAIMRFLGSTQVSFAPVERRAQPPRRIAPSVGDQPAPLADGVRCAPQRLPRPRPVHARTGGRCARFCPAAIASAWLAA